MYRHLMLLMVAATTAACVTMETSRPVLPMPTRSERTEALRGCEDELTYRIGRTAGGRVPQALIEERSADIRIGARDIIDVSGRGVFYRDRNDRGDDFRFSCAYDLRSRRANANFSWIERPMPVPPPIANNRPFFTGGIVNQVSGKGLDVVNESRADGAAVQLWDFGGKGNQSWEVKDLGRGEYSIINLGSGKALEVKDGGARDGQAITQSTWRSTSAQRWRLNKARDGNYEIVNVATSKCLDANTSTMYKNGGVVQQWSCSAGPNQRWRLVNR